MSMSTLEKEMRAALAKRKKATPIAITKGITVVAIVQESWGGPTFKRGYYCNTISSFEAQVKAEGAISREKLKLVFWAYDEKGDTSAKYPRP